MTHTHYFFALTLPEKTKMKLQEQANEIKTVFPFKKWLHPADYHITLAFLGDAPHTKREEALQLTESALADTAAFPVTTAGIGLFGRKEQPRILWAGVEAEPRLAEVRDRVYQACLQAGFELDSRPFNPHITLARKYAGQQPFSLEDARERAGIKPVLFEAAAITLYQTHMGASPSYEPIHQIQLKNF
ncbi:RNA 2',3'-cyclic phosphodiesterase [Bacillus massiliglaciei]|uniref:RNA 2',3'-cyclic phosphodiesterase n=1 Tax=Bacillus massiliglaciei TaxID=1816693 RepID=UPI000A4DC45A|nr:RNA 2',3'-cyclic phosphodiesterase [Bacillus massiliglaciei]